MLINITLLISFLFGSVYITVGGESYYTVLESEYRGCAGLRDASNQQLEPPYDIDWCEFTLVKFAVLFRKIAISFQKVFSLSPSPWSFIFEVLK